MLWRKMLTFFACVVVSLNVVESAKPKCPERCPNTHAPVCASDGRTYSNKCQFQLVVGCWKEKIILRSEQACPAQCAAGVSVVNCFADPCSVSTCPANPTATCKSNFCGGCNAVYYHANGAKVNCKKSENVGYASPVGPFSNTGHGGMPGTKEESARGRPGTKPFTPGDMPPVPQGGWLGNGRAPQLQLTATQITITGIIKSKLAADKLPEGSCVTLTLSDVSLMDVASFTLASKSLSASGYDIGLGFPYLLQSPKPVENELGRTFAVSAVVTSGWCPSEGSNEWIRKGDYLTTTQYLVELTSEENEYAKGLVLECYDCKVQGQCLRKQNSKKGLLGAYVPQCKADGTFQEKQCHGSTGYCWCVDSTDGTHIEGTKKGPGQGEVKCARCSLPMVTGLCRAYFPSFYYDEATKSCKSFVYGGCNGNGNRFETEGECLKACGPKKGSKKSRQDRFRRALLKPKCPERCPNTYAPVCASDGRTYSNKCQFQLVVGCWKEKIILKSDKACSETATSATSAAPTVNVAFAAAPPNSAAETGGSPANEDDSEDDWQWPVGKAPEVELTEKQITISGNINSEVPADKLPEGSCVTITLSDVSVMDVASFTLASKSRSASGNDIGLGFPYLLQSKKPVENELWRTYAVSVVVNFGWCPRNDSTEWLRKGDYLSATRYSVTLTTDKNEYTKDVILECYDCKDTTPQSGPDTTIVPPPPTDQGSCDSHLATVKIMPGAYVPQCKADGSYEEKQCHSSIGECWCVTSHDGLEIGGTRKGIRDGGEVTCACASHLATVKIMPGAFVPKCKADGSYEEKQCHSSIGECWCVTGGGIEIPCDSTFPIAGEAEAVQLSNTTILIQGTIHTNGKTIKKLPDPSCVRVVLRDHSIQDVAAFELASTIQQVPGADFTKSLPYYLKSKKPVKKELWRTYGLTVTINVGWCADATSDDTIRAGDYVTTSQHHVNITDADNFYMNVVNVECYECEDEGPKPGSTTAPPLKARCSLPMVTGLCRAYFPSFYYDGATKSCKSFVYGGCNGNGNRFDTEDECLEACDDKDSKNSQDDILVRRTRAYDNAGGTCALHLATVNIIPGAYVPQCKADGTYEEKQCLRSTGWCWCVHSTDGTYIHGTKKGPGQGEVTCGRGGSSPNESGPPASLHENDSDWSKGKTPEVDLSTTFPIAGQAETVQLSDYTTISIQGTIHTNDQTMKQLPDTSCIRVTLQDYSYQDVAAFELASTILQVPGATTKSLSYNLNSKKPVKKELWRTYGLTVTINVGWCADEASDDTIRAGDYVTTTHHHLKITDADNFYPKDVNVECHECGDGGLKSARCTLPVVTGLCRAYFPSFYYDGASCKDFVYGGCGGNANRFETRDECIKACGK